MRANSSSDSSSCWPAVSEETCFISASDTSESEVEEESSESSESLRRRSDVVRALEEEEEGEEESASLSLSSLSLSLSSLLPSSVGCSFFAALPFAWPPLVFTFDRAVEGEGVEEWPLVWELRRCVSLSSLSSLLSSSSLSLPLSLCGSCLTRGCSSSLLRLPFLTAVIAAEKRGMATARVSNEVRVIQVPSVDRTGDDNARCYLCGWDDLLSRTTTQRRLSPVDSAGQLFCSQA